MNDVLLNRRREMMQIYGSGHNLPSEYQEVEYIESVSGKNYLDIMTTVGNFIIRFAMTSSSQYLWGRMRDYIRIDNGNLITYSNSAAIPNFELDKFYTLEVKSNKFYIDDVFIFSLTYGAVIIPFIKVSFNPSSKTSYVNNGTGQHYKLAEISFDGTNIYYSCYEKSGEQRIGVYCNELNRFIPFIGNGVKEVGNDVK